MQNAKCIMNVPVGLGKRDEGRGETNLVYPFPKPHNPHNLYGNIVGRGLAPAEQAGWFIIAYGNLVGRGVAKRTRR